MNDMKMDSSLETALEIPKEFIEKSTLKTGYDKKENTWELIVKFNSDINFLKSVLDIDIEILSDKYAIIKIKEDDIPKLISYREIEYIEKPRQLKSFLDKSKNSICYNNISSDLTGKGVLISVIDSGINFLHKDFINEDGTSRIVYIWDQTIEGNAPDGFLYGSLYENEDINLALSSDNPLNIVPHVDTVGHGTAVGGIAFGNGKASKGRYTGIAKEASIIVVKLGKQGSARSTEIMRAIKFSIDKAISLNMPLVINLSFGTNEGAHSGYSLFETYINDMSNLWKTAIVVANGNEGASANHFSYTINSNEELEIEISVGELVESLYIVLYKDFVDEFDIKIVSPSNEQSIIINDKTSQVSFNFKNENLYFNLGNPSPYTVEQGIFFELIAKEDFILKGIWKIIINAKNIVNGKFDIWLPITETISKNIKFLNPSIETTLTIPATATNVISVGGYNSLINSIADFSGRGYTSIGLVKPDIVAPAVNIMTTNKEGGYDTFSGTSFATPFVSGACALLMQWGIIEKNDPFLYGQRIKAYLRLGAKRTENIDYPNNKWGYGSLCIDQIFKYLQKGAKVNTMDNKNLAYSNDYIEVLAQYNAFTLEILQKYDFIKFCKKLIGEYAVLFIEINKINLLTEEEISKMSLELPFCLGLMNKSALLETGVLAIQNQPFLSLRGNGVLIGIVDTGINYTLEEFKYEDGSTKIVSIWDQSIEGTPPKDFCFGTEYKREDIDKALNSDNPFDIVKTKDDIGHGTKLASIISARENIEKNFIGVAPDSELVIVKLAEAKESLRDYCFIDKNTPAYNSSNLILGIEYLYKKSLELKNPIAICIALGTNSGLHNGLSIVEQYINNIATKVGVIVSIANGNEADTQHHNLTKLEKTGDEKIIEFKIAEKENGIMLNIATYPSDKVAFELISPLGETTGKILPIDNLEQEIKLVLSNSTVNITQYNKMYQNSGQLSLIRITNPSFGNWKLKLYGEKILIGNVHSWLPIRNFIKDETYFLTPEPFYTVTTPSTAKNLLSVGGYNHITNSNSISSSRGPNRLNELKPIISAPSENVSCINTQGSLDIISGTSVACAIATGCSALLLEWGIVKENNFSINSISAIGYFAYGAKRDPNETYPNNISGFGRLNIMSTFENI